MKGRYWDSSIETMPRDELEVLQWRRLKSQIRYVYSHSQFYHDMMKRAKLTPSDMDTRRAFEKKFPVTTKDDVRSAMQKSKNALPHLCVPREQVARLHRTSGTTGLPTFNAYTAKDTENWADIFCRVWYMMGLRPGDRLLYIIWNGSPTVPIILAAGKKMGFEVTLDDIHVAPSFADTARFSESNVLFAGTNIPALLEEELRKKGLTPKGATSFRFQALSGDVMSDARREILTETWGSEIFSYGGAAETNLVYGECQEHSGLHCLDEDFFVHEVLAFDSDEPVAPGEKGRLVVTDMCTEGSPHIRFSLGDAAKSFPETCNCGRTHFKMTILGRSADQLKVGEKTIFPREVEEIIRESVSESSSEYQVIKYAMEMDELRVNVSLDVSGRSEALKSRIEDGLAREFGVRVKVQFVDVDSVARAPGGHKIPRVIDLTRK